MEEKGREQELSVREISLIRFIQIGSMVIFSLSVRCPATQDVGMRRLLNPCCFKLRI